MPPPKHKEFSDADKLQGTAKALGGNAPPGLWTPDMPIKSKKQKKKNKVRRDVRPYKTGV